MKRFLVYYGNIVNGTDTVTTVLQVYRKTSQVEPGPPTKCDGNPKSPSSPLRGRAWCLSCGGPPDPSYAPLHPDG